MCTLFIFKNRWGEQFRRVAVGELGKVFLILSHKIHDVKSVGSILAQLTVIKD